MIGRQGDTYGTRRKGSQGTVGKRCAMQSRPGFYSVPFEQLLRNGCGRLTLMGKGKQLALLVGLFSSVNLYSRQFGQLTHTCQHIR